MLLARIMFHNRIIVWKGEQYRTPVTLKIHENEVNNLELVLRHYAIDKRYVTFEEYIEPKKLEPKKVESKKEEKKKEDKKKDKKEDK